MKKLSILIIAPDCSRTGAPMLLLHMLSLLKEKYLIYSIDLITEREGDLISEYQKLIRHFLGSIEWQYDRRLIIRLKNRLMRFLGKSIKSTISLKINGQPAAKYFKDNKYDLIIANTITQGGYLKAISPYVDCPTISYVHELELFISLYMHPAAIQDAIDYTQHFVVPCKEAADNLMNKYGVKGTNISIVPSALKFIRQPEDNIATTNFKKQKYLVGSIGTPTWIKGADLFVQTCILFFSLYPEYSVEFVWIGGEANHPEFIKLKTDLDRTSLSDRVRLLSVVDNPLDYLKTFDLLLISSREECFPLVLLEAASLQVPVIGFQGTGGGASFLENVGIPTVPYADCLLMAKQIARILEDAEMRTTMGQQLHESQKAKHCPKSFMKKWEDLIESLTTIKRV